MLVIETDAEILIELVGCRQVEKRAKPGNFTASADSRAAKRGDIAVLLGALEHQAHAIGNAGEVIAGPDLGVIGIFGSNLETQSAGVAFLKEIAVA